MRRLIIVGAGGMGRTMYFSALESVGYGENFVIGGFIDDNLDALSNFRNYPRVICRISEYKPQLEDVFALSIGGECRRQVAEHLLLKGGQFFNLIHSTARIGVNAELGEGNFIGAYSVIGPDAKIGNYNMIQSYTVVGHDAKIGDWNRIDTHVTCVGGIEIHNGVTIHTSAVINHGVVVESNSHVGACSFVIRRVKEGTSVYGNPAKRLL